MLVLSSSTTTFFSWCVCMFMQETRMAVSKCEKKNGKREKELLENVTIIKTAIKTGNLNTKALWSSRENVLENSKYYFKS